MKQIRNHWLTAAAPLAFGVALTLVITSCGRASSPTSPSATSASLVANVEDPAPSPSPEPDPDPSPSPTPEGGEGCTPGYWKQEQHFDSYPAPYTSATLFNAVFDDVPEFAGLTLPEVAALGGGGIYALGRHTVAALLSSASSGVDYDLTTAQVISMFNAAYPGGDLEGLKNIFAGFNEQGCPLD